MIKISYSVLCGFEFAEAIKKLATTQMNTAAAFRVLDVVKKVNEARKKVTDEYNEKILPEIAVLDNGKPVPCPASLAGFKLQDHMTNDSFKEVTEKFGAREMEINTNKISQATLEQAVKEFSPMEVLALEPIYTSLTLASEEGKPSVQ